MTWLKNVQNIEALLNKGDKNIRCRLGVVVRRKNVYNVEGRNNESFSMKIIRRFQNLNSVTKNIL